MGIIKVITHADAGEDYLINCRNYVTGGHTKYCGAVNVRSDDALNQFMAVKRYFGKVSGNQVVHFVVVLDTRFRNLEAAVNAGYRIANFFSNEYQLLFGVHEQTMENRRGKPRSYYHIHIVINPVSFVNGKMYSNDWTDVMQFKQHVQQATGDYQWKLAFGHDKSIEELLE